MCDTPVSVCDGWGQRVSETQPEEDRETAEKYYAVQPMWDTPVSVYDGGGQHTSETQPEVNRDAAKKYYVIHVDKLKLCTAATQSPDSVATQPTTQ